MPNGERNRFLAETAAKAFEAEIPAEDVSQSPTLTEEMTTAGVAAGSVSQSGSL